MSTMRLRSGVRVNSPKHEEVRRTKLSKDKASPYISSENKSSSDQSPLQKQTNQLTSNVSLKNTTKRYAMSSLKIFTIIVLVLLFVCPFLLHAFPWIYTEIVFLQRIKCPPFREMDSPLSNGLNHTRSLRLPSTDGVHLGVWHLLPGDLHGSHIDKTEEFESALKQNFPVMLYLHGNLGSRAGWHRVELYKKLSKMNFHVIAFDYRGFADSTGYPSEQGVLEDSLAVYSYIKSINNDVEVHIWGHSLGSGIATKLTRHLNLNNMLVESLILESGFNNLADAASMYPVTMVFSLLPWINWAMDGLAKHGLEFASDKNIADVRAPTLILHAEDDIIVPYELGKKLYETAREVKSEGIVEFVTIDGSHGYGHKHIHMHNDLENIISTFTGWPRSK